jgi:ATP-dependent Lhr-like helicase
LRAHGAPEHGRADSPLIAPTLVLAAADPANPYGAVLPWPAPLASAELSGDEPARRRGHQPARKAGALTVLVDGACVLYVERGGRTLLSFTDDPAQLQPAADALALTVRDGALGRLQVERADGAPVVTTALGEALAAAGFRPTPRGLRLRG